MSTILAPVSDDLDLDRKYRPGGGSAILTGVQAIARLLIEQHARDTAAGRRVGIFISGYPGSPLGGLDIALQNMSRLHKEHDIHHVPGLNEELAATAVWGSQSSAGPATRDGVVGVWYGKAPGVDRAGDALRHGNYLGADPRGGALVLAGDDPSAKSSTLPCASEQALSELMMPVFYPADAREIVLFGLYGIALSRLSGCWVGMKLTSDVCDGLWATDISPAEPKITLPSVTWEGRPWRYAPTPVALPPASQDAERQLFGPRWEAVKAFAAANPVNTIEVAPAQAWLGIAAAGKTASDVRQALSNLGLDDAALAAAGIRVLRIGMAFPVDQGLVRRFAEGVRQILVVEEKRPFIENQIREACYGQPGAPQIIGKRDETGAPLVPGDGELSIERITAVLRHLLGSRLALPPARSAGDAAPLPLIRTPYFCSGCPHSRSTVLPADSIGAGGIGCHVMVAMMPREESRITGVTQMGGDGAQWIGQAPFTTVQHIFQNIGDGTYFHSGQLAVSACVAAGVNITFKLLYNSAVAMTGGQDAVGSLPVPALVRKLRAEGVARVIVCADDPGKYPAKTAWPAGTVVWPRARLDEAQRLLRDIPGVTVLIYDQQCAAEARRRRKRGQQAPRRTRVFINEAVCEGCGDCGVISNCLSLRPVDTDFGRKVGVDQASCNTDYSCADGECPSFAAVTVEPETAARPAKPARSARPAQEPPQVDEPVRPEVASGSYDIVLTGVGGTGVVTVNQVLATAALAHGLTVAGMDQTGLSQKGGPVMGHLRVARGPLLANRVSPGMADCYLGFDLLVAADPRNLGYLGPHSAAVVSTSEVPTGAMVRDITTEFPVAPGLLARITSRAAEDRTLSIDSIRAAEGLAGDPIVANFLVVGMAYQAGLLPMSAQAIERAIRLNGVAVDRNILAFRWGRVAVADPAAFAKASRMPSATAVHDGAADHGAAHHGAATARSNQARATGAGLLDRTPLSGATRAIAELSAGELVAYASRRTALRYLRLVESAWQAERAVGEATAFSEAVARYLFKVIAYKDEYEVARLLTAPWSTEALRAAFPAGRRPRYLLRPPMLHALGLNGKIAVGRWGWPVLRMLARLRWLRGTPLDPFGYAKMRRTERQLAAEYQDMVRRLTSDLCDLTYQASVTAASAPELIRGYDSVKMASIARYRARLAEIAEPTGATPPDDPA